MGYTAHEAATRAGVGVAVITRLTHLGILVGDADGGYSDADVRRVLVAGALERAGLSVEGLAGLVRDGRFSLDFIDDAGYNVFSGLSALTFADVSARTGIPVGQLTVLRDVTGGTTASADDLVHENELAILPLVEYQVALGFDWHAIERALRVYGDSLRRVAEAEAEWWRSEVQEPMLAAGAPVSDLGQRAGEISPRLSEVSDRALMAIYHAQQAHVWSTNIVGGIAAALEQAGLHTMEERVPAVCFVDLTGYTDLTQEAGDEAAAELAERLNRIVRRVAVEHGGRPVKWLGDGVMLLFPEPGDGVLAALELIGAVEDAGLPRAHIGLHAGAVIRQEGDYYGQTVNVASRIGEFARPGEVLVSRAVVETSDGRGLGFDSIGPIQLKGVSGSTDLFAARRT
jgi:adenylate cyclase